MGTTGTTMLRGSWDCRWLLCGRGQPGSFWTNACGPAWKSWWWCGAPRARSQWRFVSCGMHQQHGTKRKCAKKRSSGRQMLDDVSLWPGANRCIYWVTKGGFDPWVRLPHARASQIRAVGRPRKLRKLRARQWIQCEMHCLMHCCSSGVGVGSESEARSIKHMMSGDLSSEVISTPWFPGPFSSDGIICPQTLFSNLFDSHFRRRGTAASCPNRTNYFNLHASTQRLLRGADVSTRQDMHTTSPSKDHIHTLFCFMLEIELGCFAF